jgi:hypothetical protein
MVSNYPYLATLLRLVRFPTVRTRKALGMLGLNEATNQGARNPLPRAIKQEVAKIPGSKTIYLKEKGPSGKQKQHVGAHKICCSAAFWLSAWPIS